MKTKVQDNKVVLRRRTLKNGKDSLYLDYMKDGERVRECLHIYLEPMIGRIVNARSKEALKRAEAIRLRREVDISEGREPVKSPKEMQLLDYIEVQRREYLTLDEVRLIADSRIRRKDDTQEAFLFACFTGLRISDILTLYWEDIRWGVQPRIEIRQKKTKELVYIPLSENAVQWLPMKRRNKGFIYRLPSTAQTYFFRNWTAAAGIHKHISFHCSRHTYATLLLTFGADIYTVSKLLSHTSIINTQIYAKIIDEKKQQAVNLIPRL